MLAKGLKVVEILDVQGRGARAGIKQGDVLIKVNEIQLERVEDLISFMANHADKQHCTLSIVTAKEEFKLLEIEVGTLGLSLAPVEIIENFNSRLYDDIEREKESKIKEKENKIKEKESRRSAIELSNAINNILVSTTPSLEGYKIVEYIDVVISSVKKRGNYSTNKASQDVIFNLKNEVYRKGANAIIGVTFGFSSNISNQQGWLSSEIEGFISTEITHYISGTAVRVEKIKDN